MRLISACYNEFHPFDTLLSDLWTEAAITIDPDDLRPGDVLILWGGIDIDPARYGQPNIASDTGQARRDKIEFALASRATELGIPVIGVCRGLQLLTVINGGVLIQDCDNHATGMSHITNTSEFSFEVNSYHHQMCVPKGDDHQIIATSPQLCQQQTMWKDQLEVLTGDNLLPNVEAVLWKDKKHFGVQWHPEWMDTNSPATVWTINQIRSNLVC